LKVRSARAGPSTWHRQISRSDPAIYGSRHRERTQCGQMSVPPHLCQA